MANKLKNIIASILVMFGIVTTPLVLTGSASAAPKNEVCAGIGKIDGSNDRDCEGNELNGFIRNIINILLFIVGAVAVIMIILGGLRFITSNGDQSQVKAGRETILYSVIGLIVAIMSYAIVNFIVFRL